VVNGRAEKLALGSLEGLYNTGVACSFGVWLQNSITNADKAERFNSKVREMKMVRSVEVEGRVQDSLAFEEEITFGAVEALK
jgi:hypothetical protein